MKPKELVIFDKISSDGDSGFRSDFSESNSGSQRGMTFTPSDETRRGSTEPPKAESGFKFLRRKIKISSSSGSPTIVTYKPKKSGPIKENFIQKTKRKLFGKSKKSGSTKPKSNDSQVPEKEWEGMKAEDKEDEKKPIEERPLHFSGSVTERRVGAATTENENADVKNKHCSFITKPTNYGEIRSFVTRPRSIRRVMYDFRAREENDVSVRRGEMVTVLNKDDEDWWWVENSKLEQGFVPKKYIWPCACYVCQKFVLQRVVNIPGEKRPGREGYAGGGGLYVPVGMAARGPVCCMNRHGINVTRPLAKTWC